MLDKWLMKYLTLSMLDNISSRWHFEIFFLFFPENKIWQFMQIVSFYEVLETKFLKKKKKKKKYNQFVVCWICS